MSSQALLLRPLDPEVFAPFGDVIAAAGAKSVLDINAGTAKRFHDLARIDTSADGGRSVLSLFRAQPRAMPFAVVLLERHPLGSQAFVPLRAARYVVVVATSPSTEPLAFLIEDGAGVNFHRGVWHHPLIVLDSESEFLVIDRAGPGRNCDEANLKQPYHLELPGDAVDAAQPLDEPIP